MALLLLLLATAAPHALAKAVPLSSSVMIFSNEDFDTRCPQLLQAAATHGSNSVNIVPTFYWIDDRFRELPRTCNPDGWAAGSKVDSYCYYQAGKEGCQPWTKKAVAEATRGFASCLTLAFDLFDEVLISPHLDDGTRTSHWRNMLIFDPLSPDVNGFSYFDIMIRPITRAATSALSQKRAGHKAKTFWFAMQGEMGGTVFHHPQSYITIASMIRADLKRVPATVLVGVLLNHAYLPGVVNRGPDAPPFPLPGTPLAPLSGGWGPLLPFDEWPGSARIAAGLPAARVLLRSVVDFMGISNYNRAPADVTVDDMENAVAKYDAELAAMGINFLDALKSGKKFIYNEVAIGGGVSECGNVSATEPWQVGRYPWMGIFSGYKKALDPFKTFMPSDADVPARSYMRSWYSSLLKVLDQGGVKYPVSGSYIWNCASWDVQGIFTRSGEGSYADPLTVDRIQKHNAAAAAEAKRGA